PKTNQGVHPMEMHQIRYFLALSEELNFTRAARRCGVTQPSLTNAIRALETELNGPLFHRKPRIVPTELGRAIRPYLEEVARHVENAREMARMLAPAAPSLSAPRFRVATNGSTEPLHAEQV